MTVSFLRQYHTHIVVITLLPWSVVSAGFDLTHWRIPGVLQRFGITYFVVALTELLTAELYARWNVSEGETRSECS